MVSLEQIRILENKITKACELIGLLKKENATLVRAVESSQKRMSELELYVNQFKNEQVEIESGIMKVLAKLDELEDDVSEKKGTQDNVKDQDADGSKHTRAGTARDKKPDTHAPDLYDSTKMTTDATILRDSVTDSDPVKENSSEKREAELDIF